MRQEGADWGEAAITEQLVRQDIGAIATNLHLEPVEMTIPLRVREEGSTTLAEAAQPIQQKIGLYQRERGGWIRRDFATEGGFAGSVGYQVLRASMSGLQGWLFAHEQVAPEVVLKALRSPLCYATVEAESEEFKSEEGLRHLIFELAEVLGTHPGLIRIRIKNTGEEDWRGLILAGESRDLAQDETADTTAAMAYNAADLTPKGGAEVKTVEGVKVIEHDELTTGWLSILNSKIAASELHMTHLGVRRVWIRAYDPSAETDDERLAKNEAIKEENELIERANKYRELAEEETQPLIPLLGPIQPQFRLRWRPLGSVQWTGDRIVKAKAPGWSLVDLGEARPELAALGDQRWEWDLQARAPSGAGKVRLHVVLPLPTEQFCVVKAPELPRTAEHRLSASPGLVEDQAGFGTVAWGNPSYAKEADEKRTTANFAGGFKASHYLIARNFGLELGPAATVLGVTARVERRSFLALDAVVRLVVSGEVTGEDKSVPGQWPTSDGIRTYGGSDDLWGLSSLPTAAVNAEDFGIAIAAQGDIGVAEIDSIGLTIYYTEADLDDLACFAGRSIEFRSDGIFRQHRTDDVWGKLIPADRSFLPYASPSGMEGRKSRFILVPSQGDLGKLPDSGDNSLSAQAFTRPAYLFAREMSPGE